jgi:L-aspartate oxidase
VSAQEGFLLHADLESIPSLTPTVLVIGSGIAGLTAALAAAETGQVLLVTKSAVRASNTWEAQGGIAAAIGPGDSPELHKDDTLQAGAGLCDEAAVDVLVEEGVERCRELIDWRTPFDRREGEIAFTMEAAHSRRRILHASGDATGRAIVDTLLPRVESTENLRLLENHFVVDLLHDEGVVYGALVLDQTYGRLLRVEAGATVVATGGLGRIYRETTNPEVATGDGYALAFRAGATLRDMEFVQFHPTTLYLAGAPRFLISESVRGEGGRLLNLQGERFMERYSPEGELAPRDVVSRAIFQEINATGTTHVLLDLSHLGRELVERRFPTISALCGNYGLDLAIDPIPVKPAVHYMMGGIRTDLDGFTGVERLFAAGEAACTGVHGANRLASNSLLEGLVFGRRAGRAAALASSPARFPHKAIRRRLAGRTVPLDMDDVERSLLALTWRALGVYRDAGHLGEAERTIAFWERYILPEQFQARGGFEIQNKLIVAHAMVRAALARKESRGAHQRTDFPDTDPDRATHSDLAIEDLL